MYMKQYNCCPTTRKGDNPTLTILEWTFSLAQLLLNRLTDFDETLHKGRTWHEDVHEAI